MAESADKAVKDAEQAYAAAAAAEPVTSASAEAVPAAPMAAAKKTAKPASKKPVVKTSRKISKPRRRPARKPKAAAASAAHFTLTELKEKIMATAKTTDFSKPFTDAVSEMQSKAKSAFDKGTEVAAEMSEFAKGNVEALVESGKVYAAGVQDFGKSYVEEAKSAYETLTADLKEFASVKSPAELFQLQARIARRNFEAMVAYGSKNTDAVSKLASDAFAPISGRISLAAEKISKAA